MKDIRGIKRRGGDKIIMIIPIILMILQLLNR